MSGKHPSSGRVRNGMNAADDRLSLPHRFGGEIFIVRDRAGRGHFLDGLADQAQYCP